MKVFSISVILTLTLSINLNAKGIGHYEVSLKIDDKLGGATGLGSAGSLLGLLGGWECSTSSSITYKESIPDHKGNLKELVRTSKSRWEGYFSSNSNFKMGFDNDMLASNPKTVVNITENCSKTYIDPLDAIDENGNVKRKTKSLHVSWKCEFDDNLPKTVGGSSHMKCEAEESSFPSFDFEEIAMKSLKQRTITANFKLKSKDEMFVRDFCNGSEKNKVIIHLQQGVGGHYGENDFVFKIDIDGKHQFEIPSKDGLLSEDIAYCGASDKIKVKVTAIEKDLIWNDKYIGKEGIDTLILDRSDRSSGTVHLVREAKPTKEKYHSDVVVTLFDPSGKPQPRSGSSRPIAEVGAEHYQ